MKKSLNPITHNLRENTLGGIKWGVVDKGANIFIQFFVGIILARLLPPEDFGLIGLAMIIVGFSQIFVNLGFGPALIQRQIINEKHIQACFTISGLAGMCVAALVFLSAFPLANILGDIQVAPIIRVLSVIFIFNGLEIPSISLLRKWLNFRLIFYVNITKLFFYGFVTISLALNDFGVWSLVFGNIVSNFLSLILNYAFVRHNIVPLFPKKEIRELSYFGTGMTINGVFNYFALKGDYFVVGRILGTYELGLYTRAYTLMQMPTSQFVSIISNVLFPATSMIQKDMEKTKRMFSKSITIISFLVTPVCLLIIILAPDVIGGLYGEKWLPAVIPLQILCGVGFLRATYSVGGAFLRAKGLVYKLFWANIIYSISMLFAVWVGAQNYGMIGASIGVSLSIIIIWSVIMYLNSRTLNIKFSEIIEMHIPGIILGLMISVILLISRNLLALYFTNHFLILFFSFLFFLISGILSFLLMPTRFLQHIPTILLDLVTGFKINTKLKSKILWLLNLKSHS